MAKCNKCLWSDQCHTDKDNCSGYTPIDEYEGLDEMIMDGLYEFRHIWPIYTQEIEE